MCCRDKFKYFNETYCTKKDKIMFFYHISGLPRWLGVKESTCQCRRCWFDPWVRKIPWRRKWKLTLVFLPGKSHGQRRLVPIGLQESWT